MRIWMHEKKNDSFHRNNSFLFSCIQILMYSNTFLMYANTFLSHFCSLYSDTHVFKYVFENCHFCSHVFKYMSQGWIQMTNSNGGKTNAQNLKTKHPNQTFDYLHVPILAFFFLKHLNKWVKSDFKLMIWAGYDQ